MRLTAAEHPPHFIPPTSSRMAGWAVAGVALAVAGSAVVVVVVVVAADDDAAALRGRGVDQKGRAAEGLERQRDGVEAAEEDDSGTTGRR
jgi:hypothetical protein